MRIRGQTRRIDFWSSQARGEFAPYGGGVLELGAKWIRQHRRLCLSSLRRNLYIEVNKKVSYLNKKLLRVFEIPVLYIFYRYEHYMSISHIALIANMVHHCKIFNAEFSLYIHVQIWCGWVRFYGISTLQGYLMPNPLYTYRLNIYD